MIKLVDRNANDNLPCVIQIRVGYSVASLKYLICADFLTTPIKCKIQIGVVAINLILQEKADCLIFFSADIS